MGVTSKRRGSNGERELAKILSAIFGGSFIRSTLSGAYVGGKNAVRKQSLSKGQIVNNKGDIVPPDFLTRFVIEAKSYRAFPFHQLLQPGPCPLLDSWIKQTCDVVEADDHWFVAFKVKLKGWFVAVPAEQCAGYTLNNHVTYHGPHGEFRITELREFFRANREGVLHNAA